VDKGIFRRIGDCPTPWPCFVIAVREILEKNILKRLKASWTLSMKLLKALKHPKHRQDTGVLQPKQ
jgi:hypothetical protein